MKATLLLLLAVVGAATAVDYAGHLVVRVVPETADQVRHLGSLERFDFWIDPSAVGRFVDIRVGYFEYADLIKALDQVRQSKISTNHGWFTLLLIRRYPQIESCLISKLKIPTNAHRILLLRVGVKKKRRL